jgi:hypothetical protein
VVLELNDDDYSYNHARWEALAKANALFPLPKLDLDIKSARDYLGLERLGITWDLTDRSILCLASGGGQQSPAFAMLGAKVWYLTFLHPN